MLAPRLPCPLKNVFGVTLPLWRDDAIAAARRLWRAPGFSACAVATIMLCVGANAAIFAMVHSLVVKDLPFAEPERLLEIANHYPKSGIFDAQITIAQYLDFRENADAFDSIALYRTFGGSIGGDDKPTTRVNIARVTHDFFRTLRLEPVAGRFFHEEESQRGNDAKLLLTESYWESRYQRDPSVINRTVLFSDEPYVIVGVLPRSVEVIDPTIQVFKPTDWVPAWIEERYRHIQASRLNGRLFARLNPGFTAEQARVQMDSIEQRFRASASQEHRNFMEASGHAFAIASMQDARLGPAKKNLYLLQAAGLLVLVIGCINLANLLLVRIDSRSTELALRRALGSSRAAILRQWFMEPLLLTLCGGALAVAMAWGGIALINRLALPLLPRVHPFELNVPVVAFSLFLALLAAIAISILPLVRIFRQDLMGLIRQGAASTSSDRRLRFSSAVLVPLQLAVSLALLATTGLLLKSFANVAQIDPGFDPHNLVTVRTAVEPARQRDVEGVRQLHARVFAELRAIPGVDAVGLASQTPLYEEYYMFPMYVQGGTADPNLPPPMIRLVPIAGDYFPALGIPVIRGRVFNDRDSDNAEERVVILDEAAAERYFPGEDPLGRRIAIAPPPTGREPNWWTIVGIVGHARYDGLDETDGIPYSYVPEPKFRTSGNSYFVRSQRPPTELLGLVQSRIREVDPTLAQFHTGSMVELVEQSFADRRALVIFLALFAGLALFLATLGTYGVAAYEVSRRTREIGIRCALGATQGRVARTILAEVSWKAVLGIFVGAVAAYFIGRLISAGLFDVPPHDPAAFAVSALVLLAVTLLAAALPAWRASRIDPARALRME